MEPLTDKQIRSSFVNSTKGEAARLKLPLDFAELPWEDLDFLGWVDPGTLEAGALADFTTIALDSVRTAGPVPRLAAETAVFAASAADVRHTVVGGRHVVRDGVHRTVPDVSRALADSIAALRG